MAVDEDEELEQSRASRLKLKRAKSENQSQKRIKLSDKSNSPSPPRNVSQSSHGIVTPFNIRIVFSINLQMYLAFVKRNLKAVTAKLFLTRLHKGEPWSLLRVCGVGESVCNS